MATSKVTSALSVGVEPLNLREGRLKVTSLFPHALLTPVYLTSLTMAPSQDAGVAKVGNKDMWYDSDVEIQEPMRKILELYRGIAPADILSQVHKMVEYLSLTWSDDPC